MLLMTGTPKAGWTRHLNCERHQAQRGREYAMPCRVLSNSKRFAVSHVIARCAADAAELLVGVCSKAAATPLWSRLAAGQFIDVFGLEASLRCLHTRSNLHGRYCPLACIWSQHKVKNRDRLIVVYPVYFIAP